MSASFHPSETTLLDHVRGALNPGARVVVATHVEHCAACRADVEALEAVAGVLIEALSPAELREHALERMLAAIERPPAAAARAPLAQSSLLEGITVPAALRRADVGPTRWMAPGIRVARLRGVAADERAYLLQVAAGIKMPDHGHHGLELTAVLKGSFYDAKGRYQVGDLLETGLDNEHQPMVDSDGDCVCVIASQGVMRMKDWLPRFLQPVFGV